MPTRGYRKGISDSKVPRPHVVKARASAETYRALRSQSAARSHTLSTLIAAILDSHVRGIRVALPKSRGEDAEALRQLCRIGNNLNQIAYQANMTRLHLIEAEARACLTAVLAAVDRLRA